MKYTGVRQNDCNVYAKASWFPAAAHGGNETLAQEAARLVGYFQLPFYHKVWPRAMGRRLNQTPRSAFHS